MFLVKMILSFILGYALGYALGFLPTNNKSKRESLNKKQMIKNRDEVIDKQNEK